MAKKTVLMLIIKIKCTILWTSALSVTFHSPSGSKSLLISGRADDKSNKKAEQLYALYINTGDEKQINNSYCYSSYTNGG